MVDLYAGRHVAPEDWVPVDRRWLGLDKRSLLPAVVVAVIGLLLATVLPLIDRAVPLDDPIKAGERLDLGGGLVITPPVGWELEQGVRLGASTTVPTSPRTANAAVSNDGVTVNVDIAPFTGDPAALLDQLDENRSRSSLLPEFSITGGRSTIAAGSGLTGLAETYTSASAEGAITAFTLPAEGLGLTVSAQAPLGQIAAYQDQIAAMTRSLTREETK
ncbi:hypothetical protein ACFY36_16935 [Actinoplanes sp. NPDC000266]